MVPHRKELNQTPLEVSFGMEVQSLESGTFRLLRYEGNLAMPIGSNGPGEYGIFLDTDTMINMLTIVVSLDF